MDLSGRAWVVKIFLCHQRERNKALSNQADKMTHLSPTVKEPTFGCPRVIKTWSRKCDYEASLSTVSIPTLKQLGQTKESSELTMGPDSHLQ